MEGIQLDAHVVDYFQLIFSTNTIKGIQLNAYIMNYYQLIFSTNTIKGPIDFLSIVGR